MILIQSWQCIVRNVCRTVLIVWWLLGVSLKASGSGEVLLTPFSEGKRDKKHPAISFIREPEDLQVCVGDSASFPCRLAGTYGVPFWGINDGVYAYRDLPVGFEYKNGSLIIKKVKTSDHGTVIQCYWHVMASHIATLSVTESMDFGTAPSPMCAQQPAPDNFPVSSDQLEQLREQPGKFLTMKLNIPCGRFNQLILVNADTGFPDRLQKKNILILIDPSKGPVWLNMATLEQSDSDLALVGLPMELASTSSGAGSGLLPSGSDRTIVMIPVNQSQSAFSCFNKWVRCHFENLSFRQEEGQAPVEASPLIKLANNLDSVVKNCDFSGARTFIQQLNSKLSVVGSEFYVSSMHPAVVADQKTNICASSFYCDGQCNQAILLTPDADEGSSVRISTLFALNFPVAVDIASEENDAESFALVNIVDSEIVNNGSGASTAVQLYGNLDVSLERNNITGCVMILNPGEEECINVEENDSFFIQIENSEETPAQTESSEETPAQTESSGEPLHLMPAFIWCLFVAVSHRF